MQLHYRSGLDQSGTTVSLVIQQPRGTNSALELPMKPCGACVPLSPLFVRFPFYPFVPLSPSCPPPRNITFQEREKHDRNLA
jgi:hypothetical protein